MASETTASVKICGIRTTDMLQSIVHLPIDHIGLMFARSKRQITAEQAAPMVALLRERRAAGAGTAPLSVGVFVNPAMEELREIMRQAPLDVIQLHGQETAAFCADVKKAFGVAVFKVLPIAKLPDDGAENAEDVAGDEERRVEQLLEPYRGVADAILLDTYDPVFGGGSGQPFAWDRIPPYLNWARAAGVKLIVAGGLRPDNVRELLDGFAPDGVDVSSGVETDGDKDIDKITAFVERVKSS